MNDVRMLPMGEIPDDASEKLLLDQCWVRAQLLEKLRDSLYPNELAQELLALHKRIIEM